MKEVYQDGGCRSAFNLSSAEIMQILATFLHSKPTSELSRKSPNRIYWFYEIGAMVGKLWSVFELKTYNF